MAPHLKKRLCNSYSSQKLKWYFQVKYTFTEASVWTEKFNQRVCYLAQNQEEPKRMWHGFSEGLPCSTPCPPILSEMLGNFPCSCNNFPLQTHHWGRHALDFRLWLKQGACWILPVVISSVSKLTIRLKSTFVEITKQHLKAKHRDSSLQQHSMCGGWKMTPCSQKSLFSNLQNL